MPGRWARPPGGKHRAVAREHDLNQQCSEHKKSERHDNADCQCNGGLHVLLPLIRLDRPFVLARSFRRLRAGRGTVVPFF